MAKIMTEAGEIEIPLIFNDPSITNQMKDWRAIVEKNLGQADSELVGLAKSPNGEWLGIFRKKS